MCSVGLVIENKNLLFSEQDMAKIDGVSRIRSALRILESQASQRVADKGRSVKGADTILL
jgi:hypothetical protein